MSDKESFTLREYQFFEEVIREARIAVYEAQEESRRMGVPNVYSINGRIYYETPTGELSLEDPYPESNQVKNFQDNHDQPETD